MVAGEMKTDLTSEMTVWILTPSRQTTDQSMTMAKKMKVIIITEVTAEGTEAVPEMVMMTDENSPEERTTKNKIVRRRAISEIM
jgi:hypothetical protein